MRRDRLLRIVRGIESAEGGPEARNPARRVKRWRLARLLPPVSRRRSMICMAGSAGLPYAHVPLHEPPDLPGSEAALDHPLHEFAVFLLRIAVLLGAEADDRQQVLDLA